MPSINVKGFSDACRELYAPGLEPAAFVNRGFAFFKRMVPGEFAACGILNKAEQRLDLTFDAPHPNFPQAMGALGRLMANYPLYRWDPTVNGGRPFCRSQFYSDREFRDLDIYLEVYRPLGIDNHCAIHVPTVPGEILFFGIERAGGPDFTGEELQLLRCVQDQLANAHALARHRVGPDETFVTPQRLHRAGLTPRQAETLHWIARGKSNSEIALLMKIGLHTVKDHVTAIFNRIGAGNRLAATIWAREACRHQEDPTSAGSQAVSVFL